MTQPRIHWSFQLLAGLALLAAVLGIGIYQFVFRGPVEAAREASNLAGEIAGQMAQAFQLRPQIRERNLVVFESDRELAQIVVSETTFRASHGMEHSWLGSTKRFGIGATARARFGFDLQNPMRLEVDPDQREVRVQLPPAELLSLDLSDFEVLRDEQGI